MAEQFEQKDSKHPEKVVTMPGRDEMIEKLKQGELYGLTPQSDKVYERFVSSVAGSEKVGPGLALAWELAIYDELKDYPPMIQGMMSGFFDAAVDAVTPDSEVAFQAKEFMMQVREKARKGGK